MVVKTRLEDGQERKVWSSSPGERGQWATTVEVWEVGGEGGVKVASKEWVVLTTETKEGRGPWEGGVGC